MATDGTGTIEVTTTYLEIPEPGRFRPACVARPHREVGAEAPSVAVYRVLYDAVGRAYRWVERLAWSDAELADHLARPAVTVLVPYLGSDPVGFVELDRGPHPDEPGTQIAYFGLVPRAHGHGLGKHLLSAGVARAFADGAERVWVHTCTLDGPHALANYLARGFARYKTMTHHQPLPSADPDPA